MRDHWTISTTQYINKGADYVTNTVHWHGEDGYIEADVLFIEDTDIEGNVTRKIVVKHSDQVAVEFKPLTLTREQAAATEVKVIRKDAEPVEVG